MPKHYCREGCKVNQTINLICPACGSVVSVPMCNAVNGYPIICENCSHEFVFQTV